jgi:hypothetical protein
MCGQLPSIVGTICGDGIDRVVNSAAQGVGGFDICTKLGLCAARRPVAEAHNRKGSTP